MNNKACLILFAFSATLAVVRGGWQVETIALDCLGSPTTHLYAKNGMCVPVRGQYQYIIRSGLTSAIYMCPSSDCSTGCKKVEANLLNKCYQGVTVQFYEQEPPWLRFFGQDYLIDYLYDTFNCTQSSGSAYVYPLNRCVDSVDSGATFVCKNNQITYSEYHDLGCTSTPFRQTVFGENGVCEGSHLFKCSESS